MIEPSKETKMPQKQWMIHAVPTFYADKDPISTAFFGQLFETVYMLRRY